MLAFGLCIALFLYFLLVGSGAVRALHATRNVTQDLLISPAIGVGVTLIPVFLINRLGVPVEKCGPWIGGLLVVLAIAVHLIRLLPGRSGGSLAAARASLVDYAPFLGFILLGAYLVGRPMLNFGFDWLSFCNDDMANYCLAADRFLHNGFLTLPPVDSLVKGTDYSQSYWFFHVPSMVRAGAELMIAWTASLNGHSSQEIFMTDIVAFHLTLISAGAGMVLSSAARRQPAMVATVLLAACAQLTFGTIYQLIAQSAGLAILCVNATLLCRTFDGVSARGLFRHGILVAIGLTTQLILYPEVNPFLGAGFFFFVLFALIRRRLAWKPTLAVLGITFLLTIVLLNSYTYDAIAFMLNQRKQASSADDPAKTLFPFFLLPSGLANYWGFVRITSNPPDPWFSIAIILGGVLLIISALAAAREAWWGEPAGAVALVCAVLAVVLFRNNSGFGLYKLAMFAQPFVLATLAIACSRLLRKWQWAVWGLVLLGVPGLRSQAAYVDYSQDANGSTFNEVIGATKSHILREFRAKTPDAGSPTAPHILVDSYNISLTKLLAAYTRGRATAFPASRITLQTAIPNAPPELARQSYIDQARKLSADVFEQVSEVYFQFDPAHPGTLASRFFFYDQGGRPVMAPDGPETLLVAGTRRIGLFNRRTFGDREGNFVVEPLSKVANHLLFTETTLSQPYYVAGDTTFISVYQLESDPSFYVGQTIAGVGRYFVFEVLRPDEEVRLVLDMTCSLKGDGENELPHAFAVGTERVPFDFVGRGAGRVISPPIKPQKIRGRSYIGIDLGQFGTQFKVPRTGIMKWFGKDVALDRRLLVGFGRDISLLGAAEYATLKPPTAVLKWANNDSELRDPDLEFSGFYEDGWISEHGYLNLRQPAGYTRFSFKGVVPNLGDGPFSSSLTLKVDGKVTPFAATQLKKQITDGVIPAGPFEVTAELPPADGGRRHVELEWTRVQKLPGADGRPVAAQVLSVGLEPPPPPATTPEK